MTDEQIELLAQAIHERYLRTIAATANPTDTDKSDKSWAELIENDREANRAQARDIISKLASLDLIVAPLGAPGTTELTFTEPEIELLAHDEHERWMVHKLEAGWRPGDRNDQARTHPMIVPWDQLTSGQKDLDREPVRHIPELLALVGLGVRSADAR